MSESGDIDDLAPEERDAALGAEYALRLLGPADHAACAAREAAEPGFAAEVARWRRDLEPLDAAYPEAPPSPALRGRIETRLFGKPPSPLARFWESTGLWRGVAVVATAAALWFALPVVPPPPPPAPGLRLVSALAPVDGGAELLAVYEPEAGALRLNRVAGQAGPGRDLELWVIVGDAAPVSLGVLPEAAVARLEVPADLGALFTAGAVLAVSDEPEGGSPSGAPTGAVLAAGPLRDV